MKKKLLTPLLFFAFLAVDFFPQSIVANTKEVLKAEKEAVEGIESLSNTDLYRYPEPEEHTFKQDAQHVGFIFSLNVFLYVATQPETVSEEGSFSNYRRNLGRTVLFDNDREFWNWLVHPLSGSQLYLYYRAYSYSPGDAFRMAFISSLIFEYAIEVYTEPASLEDVINTPVLGSALGYFIEHASIRLLNSGVKWKKWLGHAINPLTLFPFYHEKVRVLPNITPDQVGVSAVWEF